MSEASTRRSLSIRKMATGLDFQIPVNLEETFRSLKPPSVPPLFKSVCEEILARIASRQLSVLPAPLATLFLNADAMAGSLLYSAQIDEVIKLLHYGKKGLNEKQRILQRQIDLEPHRTSVITRALFKYIELCSEGVGLTVNFPAFGYLIVGPPPQNVGKPDVKSYTLSVGSFIRAALEENPVKRDIFCYLMHFLSQIYQQVGNSYRTQPGLCGMTRYLLANRFGEEMVNIRCTECDSKMEDRDQNCRTCSYVTAHIEPPYKPRVIDMMLEYIPISYWREKLNDPRSGIADRVGLTTTVDDLNFITRDRAVSKVSVASHVKANMERRKADSKVERKLEVHEINENNGTALRKSRVSDDIPIEEPRKSVKKTESERDGDKSSDIPESLHKPKWESSPGVGSPSASNGGLDGSGSGRGSDIGRGSGRGSGPGGSIGGSDVSGSRTGRSIASVRDSGGVGSGSGIISSALKKDSVSLISLSRNRTPQNGMRSTLFTTPPTFSHESTASTMTDQSEKLEISTPRRPKKKRQHRPRSRTRKSKGRRTPTKSRKKTESRAKKKKRRTRSTRKRKRGNTARKKRSPKKTSCCKKKTVKCSRRR